MNSAAVVVREMIANADLNISFKIVNDTDQPLTLVDSHMDCGEQNAPTYIGPGMEGEGTVASNYGLHGVKGALIYKWRDSGNEKIVLYLQNTGNGFNKHGIKYHWKTDANSDWYYNDIETQLRSNEMIRESPHHYNGKFHLSSFVTGGNQATAAYVLRIKPGAYE